MRPIRSCRPAFVFASARSQSCPYQHHRPRRQTFHTTRSSLQKRGSPFKSISHDELQDLTRRRAERFRAYTDAEKAELAKRYTPAQLAIIEAGEAAIPAEDLAIQMKPRMDPFAPRQVDNWARVDGGYVDKKLSRLRGEGMDYGNERPVTDISDVDEDLIPLRMARVTAGRPVLDDIRFVVDQDTKHTYYRFQSKARMDAAVPEDLFANDGWARKVTTSDKRAVEVALKETNPAWLPPQLVLDEDGNQLDLFLQVDEDYIRYFFKTHSGNPYIPPSTTGLPPAPSQRYPENNKRVIADIVTLETRQDLLEREVWTAGKHDFPEVAPELPKIHDPRMIEDSDQAAVEARGGEDLQLVAAYSRLAKATGQTVDDIRSYRTKPLSQHTVVNQTRLGKIRTHYALVVAGNGRGMVGIGEGKAGIRPQASFLATLNAIRNMKPILRYEKRTIFGEVEGKTGAAVVRLMAKPPGFGLRCSSVVFEIARAAGLQDLAAKSLRSRNKMNVAKAAYAALMSQRDPEEIAMGRGRKLVDVRKVYYSGLV